MKTPPTASLLSRFGRARRPAAPDPADYGTAFGLDLSLQAAALAPPTKASGGWRQKLRLRPAR